MRYKFWVIIAASLFIAGIGIGLVFPADIADLVSEDVALLKELGGILAPFSILTLIFIFLKNVSALLFSFVFSPILCLAPVLSLLLNGLLIGFVSTAVVQERSVEFLLAGVLPHGIFEIPAFIIGEAAALSFGATLILALFKKERRKLILPSLMTNSRYMLIAFALLLPAAIIETFVTPLLLS